MALQFNLMPPRPQKSFFPKAQKNSTANSYYQQRVTNRAVLNEYQLLKDSGKPYNTNLGAPFFLRTAFGSNPGPPAWEFWGYSLPSIIGYINNDIVPLTNCSPLVTSPVGIQTLGYQTGAFWPDSFYIEFLQGWSTGLSINCLSSIAFYNEAGTKVREYTTSGMDPSQFGLTAQNEYYWWWPAFGNTGGDATNSTYTMLEEETFWASQLGKRLTISWNGSPPQIALKKSSAPQMYERFGSSDTYDDHTKDRLLKIKSYALMNSD